MGSLSPLGILLLITSEANLCSCYYVTAEGCLFESQCYWRTQVQFKI